MPFGELCGLDRHYLRGSTPEVGLFAGSVGLLCSKQHVFETRFTQNTFVASLA